MCSLESRSQPLPCTPAHPGQPPCTCHASALYRTCHGAPFATLESSTHASPQTMCSLESRLQPVPCTPAHPGHPPCTCHASAIYRTCRGAPFATLESSTHASPQTMCSLESRSQPLPCTPAHPGQPPCTCHASAIYRTCHGAPFATLESSTPAS